LEGHERGVGRRDGAGRGVGGGAKVRRGVGGGDGLGNEEGRKPALAREVCWGSQNIAPLPFSFFFLGASRRSSTLYFWKIFFMCKKILFLDVFFIFLIISTNNIARGRDDHKTVIH
jgi:hypothetical protein